MFKVAIIEDEPPISDELKSWVLKAKPGTSIEQFYTRESAQEALRTHDYDLVVLDLQLGPEKNAGVAVITETIKRPVPVLVVSGLPAQLYRGVMRALDAWDYLERPVTEDEFVETFLDVVRQSEGVKRPLPEGDLRIDPMRQTLKWKGKDLNLPLSAQRILNAIYERRNRSDPTASYQELFQVVKSGKNKANIRKQIATIKSEFKAVDNAFSSIVAEPMRGYRWVERKQGEESVQ